jgi:hypothetical protein
MKLKHIFENTPQQPKMTEKEVRAVLDLYFVSYRDHINDNPADIEIDDQGRIHVLGQLHPKANVNLDRMPLQLESVDNLIVKRLRTLENLPRHCRIELRLVEFEGQDFTSATGVMLGGSHGHPGTLKLLRCHNLRTLAGIENFKSEVQDKKIDVTIYACPNLAFDPYDYINHAHIQFISTIPHGVHLVKAIALTQPNQMTFNTIADHELETIIGKWRNQGPAAMIPLARELIAAGYTHHVR